jgi:hypothetical protein
MARLEVQVVSVVQRGERGCALTARLYALGDPVVVGGVTTYPRTLLRTVTQDTGPVHPYGRVFEILRDRAEQERAGTPQWSTLAETVL